MLNAINDLLQPAVMQRITTFFNHLVRTEPQVAARLKPHEGSVLAVELSPWPLSFLAPPTMRWVITPAGGLEWLGQALVPQPGPEAPSLTVLMSLPDPLALAQAVWRGEAPKIELRGDAALASAFNEIAQRLRWEWREDLDRWLPVAWQPWVHALLDALIEAGAQLIGRVRALRPGAPS